MGSTRKTRGGALGVEANQGDGVLLVRDEGRRRAFMAPCSLDFFHGIHVVVVIEKSDESRSIKSCFVAPRADVPERSLRRDSPSHLLWNPCPPCAPINRFPPRAPQSPSPLGVRAHGIDGILRWRGQTTVKIPAHHARFFAPRPPDAASPPPPSSAGPRAPPPPRRSRTKAPHTTTRGRRARKSARRGSG